MAAPRWACFQKVRDQSRHEFRADHGGSLTRGRLWIFGAPPALEQAKHLRRGSPNTSNKAMTSWHRPERTLRHPIAPCGARFLCIRFLLDRGWRNLWLSTFTFQKLYCACPRRLYTVCNVRQSARF